jgi:hypothetical protein
MYNREITEASKSALLELCLALRSYKSDIILAGGWAPYFISSDNFSHCGSVDIDFILKREILPKYQTIRETLISLSYKESSPFQFTK